MATHMLHIHDHGDGNQYLASKARHVSLESHLSTLYTLHSSGILLRMGCAMLFRGKVPSRESGKGTGYLLLLLLFQTGRLVDLLVSNLFVNHRMHCALRT